MNKLSSVLLSRLRSRQDDDWVDRANYLYTPSLFGIFAVVVGVKQFVGQPIQCWAPNEFKRQWMQYAETYCFVENTYFVGQNERFPTQEAERESREIIYYQWVPFLLMAQIMLMAAPKFAWEAFSWKTGLDIRTLVERAHALSKEGEQQGRERAGEELSERIQRNIQTNARSKVEHRQPENGRIRPDCVQYDAVQIRQCYVTLFYLLFKLLNTASVLLQLFVLTKFVAPGQDPYWGWGVLQDLLAGREWSQSGVFPRVTFCDFKIRQPGQDVRPHHFSLQCVLMINMINEKIFIFIWFWLGALALLNVLNLAVWLYRSLSWHSADQFVLDLMRFTSKERMPSDQFSKFVRRGLSRDGVTVLRLVAINCELMVGSLLVTNMWKRYKQGMETGSKLQRLRQLQARRTLTMDNPNYGSKASFGGGL